MRKKRTNHMKSRGRMVPGGRNSQCKGPEAALSLACGRNRTGASVAAVIKSERMGDPGGEVSRGCAWGPRGLGKGSR